MVGRGRAALGVGAHALGDLAHGVGLGPHALEPLLHAREVEARGGRAALHLAGVQQGRQRLRDVGEQPSSRPGSVALMASQLRSTSPDGGGAGRALRQLLAEDVRMAAHQLVVAVVGDLREVAGAALLEQQRQEVHLEEHVAELVQQLGVVARVGRVGELVGLLHGVRHDRPLVLLAIPGALAPQPARQGVETGDGGGDVGLGHRPSLRRRLRASCAGCVSVAVCVGVVVVCAFCFGALSQSCVT